METEFNLSEKIYETSIGMVIRPEDVKTFLTLLKQKLYNEGYRVPLETIDKLAGDELI